jgi:hypothetical protein
MQAKWITRLLRGAISAGLASLLTIQSPVSPAQAGVKSQDGLTAAKSPQLVWIDTDIGDDIDDAFALGLVLHSPELHVLGISTAFGDTETRVVSTCEAPAQSTGWAGYRAITVASS